jgi:hypothetical protein
MRTSVKGERQTRKLLSVRDAEASKLTNERTIHPTPEQSLASRADLHRLNYPTSNGIGNERWRRRIARNARGAPAPHFLAGAQGRDNISEIDLQADG